MSLSSPFGVLSVFVEDGAVVALDWGRAGQAADGEGLERVVAELEAYLSGRPMSFSVPVNPTGGAFQRRVWQRLRDIPWGTTVTYGDLARALGTAPRAVAGACARNPIPIIIPCHRVVGAGGALGGYSGGEGIATKAALLTLEGVWSRAATADPITGLWSGREGTGS